MEICPKTGKPCYNPKVIHVADTNEGFISLCQECEGGKLKEQLNPVVKNFFDLLSFILDGKQAPAIGPVAVEDVKPPCPKCGMTLREIGKVSRLGCDECYEYYRNELLPVLNYAHNASKHVGKRPKPKPVNLEELPLDKQIILLRAKINQAIEQENYETAKELTEKLKNLQSE